MKRRTDLMSHSQFHYTGRVYLDLHGLIFAFSLGAERSNREKEAGKNQCWEEGSKTSPDMCKAPCLLVIINPLISAALCVCLCVCENTLSVCAAELCWI